MTLYLNEQFRLAGTDSSRIFCIKHGVRLRHAILIYFFTIFVTFANFLWNQFLSHLFSTYAVEIHMWLPTNNQNLVSLGLIVSEIFCIKHGAERKCATSQLVPPLSSDSLGRIKTNLNRSNIFTPYF